MNSGLPSRARVSRSTSSAAGASPRMSSSTLRHLVARVRGPSETRRTFSAFALELGQQRAERMAAVELVDAVGGDDEHALAERLRARKATKARVERSAQWMSSRTKSDGRLAAEAVEQAEQRLEEPGLARGRRPGAVGARRGPSAGRRRASSARIGREGGRGPGRRRGRAGAARRRSGRRAARPRRARRSRRSAPGALGGAVGAARSTSRLLPTPESPPTSTSDGQPAVASPSAFSSSASSAARPTKR